MKQNLIKYTVSNNFCVSSHNCILVPIEIRNSFLVGQCCGLYLWRRAWQFENFSFPNSGPLHAGLLPAHTLPRIFTPSCLSVQPSVTWWVLSLLVLCSHIRSSHSSISLQFLALAVANSWCFRQSAPSGNILA